MEAPGGALFALKEPALLIRRILASLAASALFAVPGPQGFAGELEALAPHGPVGLGRLLTTKDGGQIFGFDINQNGDDGVLASAQTVDSSGDVQVSVETFDQNTG